MRTGRAAATTCWENRLLAVANEEAGNAQAIQWALRNRSRAASGRHHDAQRVEHRGPDGGALRTERCEVIDPRRLSPEHREGLRAALLAAAAFLARGKRSFPRKYRQTCRRRAGDIFGGRSAAPNTHTHAFTIGNHSNNGNREGPSAASGCRGYRLQRHAKNMLGGSRAG